MKRGRTWFIAAVVAAIAALVWVALNPDDADRSLDRNSAAPRGEPVENAAAAPAVPDAGEPRALPQEGVSREEADEPPAIQSNDVKPAKSRTPSISGKVVDDLENPVAECSVQAHRVGAAAPASYGLAPGRPSADQLVTAAAGRFAFYRLGDGEWELIARSSSGVRSVPLFMTTPSADGELILVLPRAASVDGTVTTLRGIVVPDANIYADFAGKDSERGRVNALDEAPVAMCDALGRFKIASIQPGSIRLRAKHPQYSDGEWVEFRFAPGSHGVAELRLSQGGRVRGTIDPSLGEVANRQLDLLSFKGLEGWQSTKSDAAGHYEIEHVMPQDYIIELRTPGYPDRSRVGGGRSIRKRISVREGETTEANFAADAASVLVAGIVRRGGDPVGGLTVGVRRKVGTDDRSRDCETEPSGMFRLLVEGPGEYTLTVTSDSSFAQFDRVVGPSGEAGIVLDLPMGGVTGLVVSPQGDPLGYVPVTLTRGTLGEEADARTVSRNCRSVKTTPDGSFEFDLLEPGVYTLRAPDGHWGDRPPPRTPYGGAVLTGIAVGDLTNANLRVQLELEGAIAGQAVGQDGLPIDSAFIEVLDENGTSRYARYWDLRTDVTGSFRGESIAPGVYSLRARVKGKVGVLSGVTVVAGRTSTVRIELR